GVYPVARRSGDRQLCFRPGGDDAADAGLLQRAHGGQPGDQRPGLYHPRRGRNCRIYRLVFDGARGKTARARYPACKTRLKDLKFPVMCRA
ncbi:putrescine transport system permease PotI, partial [Enterobacter roggenkampii]